MIIQDHHPIVCPPAQSLTQSEPLRLAEPLAHWLTAAQCHTRASVTQSARSAARWKASAWKLEVPQSLSACQALPGTLVPVRQWHCGTAAQTAVGTRYATRSTALRTTAVRQCRSESQ